MFNSLRNGLGDGMEEARGCDGLAETEATGCENDDGPQEIVEVLLGEDARSKEKDQRDNRYHAHVTKCMLELVTDAPESDSSQGYDGDKVLNPGKFVFTISHGYNCRSPAGVKCNQ